RREVEVHIAQAANGEARGVAAGGAYDLQAGHAARQLRDVPAAGVHRAQRGGVRRRDGEGHVADAFAAALGGDDDVADGGGLFGRGVGRLRQGRRGEQQGQTAGGGGENRETRHRDIPFLMILGG